MSRARKPLEGAIELPLFPAAAGRPPKSPQATQESPARPVRPLGHARCPRCSRARAAVITSGSHVVWREHDLITYAGTRLPCPSSGVALCILPAKLEPGAAPLGCSH